MLLKELHSLESYVASQGFKRLSSLLDLSDCFSWKGISRSLQNIYMIYLIFYFVPRAGVCVGDRLFSMDNWLGLLSA